MKKKNKSSFLGKFIKFFDKKIVIPLTRLILKIANTFDKSSHSLEKIFANQTTLLFISLTMALFIFLFVDQKKLQLVNNSAEVFKNQPVTVDYNEERFVLEGVPENVDITLIGSKADLYIAKQKSDHTVKIDLNDIKNEGTYKVDLDYKISSNINATVNPSQATIRVYLKKSENRTLSSTIVNADKLDSSLGIDKVTLNVDQVIISGAEHNLEKVATVEALVDIDKLNTKSAGTQTLDDILLRAYDAEGNIVNVEINSKEKVKAEVTISSSSREVPLNFVMKEGTHMPFGKAISSFSFSQSTVTAYGPQSILDDLEKDGIDIEFDVSKLSSDYKGTVDIPTPNGIKKLSVSKVTLNIKVTNSVSSPQYNMTLSPNAINTPSGYTPGFFSKADSEILIKPTCAENVCKSLSSADLEAYVDLSSLATAGPGTYKVQVKYRAKTSNARLAEYTISPSEIRIKLTKN